MNLDLPRLNDLRRQHPAWRLLRADTAPLVISFLHRMFVAPNVRLLPRSRLVEALEDSLSELRAQQGASAFPKAAEDYLDDWAAAERGWLRKFHPPGADEPQFDLTPATEQAIAWLAGLEPRGFVGVESRLLVLGDLLRQMSEGSETDPQARLQALQRRRDEIDAEIARVRQGNLPPMDDTALKDRFQLFTTLADGLLADFRQVEQQFRAQVRQVCERVGRRDGAGGDRMQALLAQRDALAHGDQGRSFRAFWEVLSAPPRQDTFRRQLDRVLRLPAVAALAPDPRILRTHRALMEAGEHTRHAVLQLSQQLRRFLDEQAWQENRRITDLLHSIEAQALPRQHGPAPTEPVAALPDAAPASGRPLQRLPHLLAMRPWLANLRLGAGLAQLEAALLFSQFAIDRASLVRHVRRALEQQAQVSLRQLLQARPLAQGLAELLAYLQLACDRSSTVIDEGTCEPIAWTTPEGRPRLARLPRVVFLR